MLEVMSEKESELLSTLVSTLEDMPELIEELGDEMRAAAMSLRVDYSQETFSNLTAILEGLKNLINYVDEVKYGVDHLAERGLALDATDLDCWEEHEDLFQELLNYFEVQDWVGVADLMEYELIPLLEKGKEAFVLLRESIRNVYPV